LAAAEAQASAKTRQAAAFRKLVEAAAKALEAAEAEAEAAAESKAAAEVKAAEEAKVDAESTTAEEAETLPEAAKPAVDAKDVAESKAEEKEKAAETQVAVDVEAQAGQEAKAAAEAKAAEEALAAAAEAQATAYDLQATASQKIAQAAAKAKEAAEAGQAEDHLPSASATPGMTPKQVNERIAFLKKRQAELKQFIEEEEERNAECLEGSHIRDGIDVMATRQVRIRLPSNTQPGQRYRANLPGDWEVELVAPVDAVPGMQMEVEFAVRPVFDDDKLEDVDDVDDEEERNEVKDEADEEEEEEEIGARSIRIRLPTDMHPGQRCAATLPGGWPVQFVVPVHATPGMLLDIDMALEQCSGLRTMSHMSLGAE